MMNIEHPYRPVRIAKPWTVHPGGAADCQVGKLNQELA